MSLYQPDITNLDEMLDAPFEYEENEAPIDLYSDENYQIMREYCDEEVLTHGPEYVYKEACTDCKNELWK